MSPNEIKRYFDLRLSAGAREWMNGASQDVEDEFVIQAQREGVESAVREIELIQVCKDQTCI